MQWYNHKLTTCAIVYSLTGDVLSTVCAIAGSVLPDAAEFPFKPLIKHRTITHWFPIYLTLSSACAYYYSSSNNYLYYLLMFVMIGGLLHIFQDGLSKGGIPITTPFSKPRGLKLYKVYSVDEMIVSFALVSTFLIVAFFQGYLTPEYLTSSADKFANQVIVLWKSIL